MSCEPQQYVAFRLLPAALCAAQSAGSQADFEVFRPTGATRCTDAGEIWRGGGDD